MFSRHSFLIRCKLKRATSDATKRHVRHEDRVRASENTILLSRDA